MCAPFLGILRVYGGPEDAAYMRDMYLPLADYFRREYPRLASYHEWDGHFEGPNWEEHVSRPKSVGSALSSSRRFSAWAGKY
jgi:hypothetical protein